MKTNHFTLLLALFFSLLWLLPCNGIAETVCYIDQDGDGFAGPYTVTPPDGTCDAAEGEYTSYTDCDDTRIYVYPGAVDILCNGLDENCDGMDDKNSDGDPVTYCNGDCDDFNPNRYPGNTEILCDGVDSNCNGLADDDKNTDGDPVTYCNGDCDDADPNRYPGNTEILCDGVDNNCNGLADDDQNSDGDPVSVCDGDCDDTNSSIYPGAAEIPSDAIDQDCNGLDAVTCYVDSDKDGYGAPAQTVVAPDGTCDTPEQESSNDSDCDDSQDSINPGAMEITGDGIDQDCDGKDYEAGDADGDGVPNDVEDLNGNGLMDDDTDNDGIPNYLDPDDDGDGILTVDEDQNGNGDPTDDDSDGDTIPDYLDPIADNIPPEASAGPDRVVFDSVTLDGSGSSDSDGQIVSWEWEIVHRSNPESNISASGEIVTLNSLDAGFYDVTLTVTDNDGGVDTDTFLMGAAGAWDVNGDHSTGLEEIIHGLQMMSGMR